MLKNMMISALFALSSVAVARTDTTSAGNLTDAQIAQVLINLDNAEAQAGRIARMKAQDPKVKEYAKLMIDEHKSNANATKKVAMDNGLYPKNSDFSRALREESKTTAKDMKNTAKSDFDKFYMQNQIAMHQKALDTLDNVLIPSASKPSLKAHLDSTRDDIVEHLEHAKTIDSNME